MKQNRRKLKLLNFFNKRNTKNRKKSSERKRRIFASAILVGNLLFVNWKPNDLKTSPTPLSHEKVISNQELNSLDGFQNSGKIIQTGNGTILEFEQEVYDTSSNKILEESERNIFSFFKSIRSQESYVGNNFKGSCEIWSFINNFWW